jgi:3-hydroxyacyl-[acyl-carrier-protein] dehydratase
MEPHFRAFSFVDRITAIHDGRRVRGSYAIPAAVVGFPLALVGEAIGQLAAWAAMAAVNFEFRPLAGLAGSVQLMRPPGLGRPLELLAIIEDVDAERVAYNGVAHQDGEAIACLHDCVGPMVPLPEFDDPVLVRQRFEVLQQEGADAGGFMGLPPLVFERAGGDPGRSADAIFRVPVQAPFFGDHFPRRPLFPGSLLMHLKIQLGLALAAEILQPSKGQWALDTIRDMKLRTFIPPGAALRLAAKLKQISPDEALLALETRTDKELVATASLRLTGGDPTEVHSPASRRSLL